MSRIIVASERGHWYREDGSPAYTVIGKNGKERNTTLRDARKENLFPSVTTILKCKPAPALEIWKQNQILLSAATLPIEEGESVDDWCKRVHADSKEEGIKAAEKGTKIHGQIERFLKGKKVAAYHKEVAAVDRVLQELKMTNPDPEKSFANRLGYAGKIDLPCLVNGERAIIDIKSKEFKPKKKLHYDDQCIQLAGYSMGRYGEIKRLINVFISRNLEEPEAIVHEWSKDEGAHAWEIFRRYLEIWQIEKGYRPVVEGAE